VLLSRNHSQPKLSTACKRQGIKSNQWEIHLIEFKYCEDPRPGPQLQKAKAQHSMLMGKPNIQGYREVKLYVILVGAMETIYKDYTDKSMADLNLDYHKLKKLTQKLNEHSIRHASALIKTRYALQQQSRIGSGCYGTAHIPPDPHKFFFRVTIVCAWCGHLSTLPPNHAGCVITTSRVLAFYHKMDEKRPRSKK